MATAVPNQSSFQTHPNPQLHSLPNYNHVYAKSNPVAANQVFSTPPPPSMVRPSQHQMAQHLMNPQAHMRSQRMMQQQQQHQQQQQQQQQHQQIVNHHQREEQMMILDPLDSHNNRHLAFRRYTNHHININSIFGTHWTVDQLLREDHIRLASKRKETDSSPSDSVQQRKDRLRQKIDEIERDINASTISYQAQLNRFQST